MLARVNSLCIPCPSVNFCLTFGIKKCLGTKELQLTLNLLFSSHNGLLLTIQSQIKLQWMQIQDICLSPVGFRKFLECYHLLCSFLVLSLLQIIT